MRAGDSSTITFGEFMDMMFQMKSPLEIKLNREYSAKLSAGGITKIDGIGVSIETIERAFALTKSKRKIKPLQAVVIKNDAERNVITTVAKAHGIEVDTIKNSGFKEIVFNDADFLSGNPVKTNSSRFEYISFTKFVTGLVMSGETSCEVMGYTTTLDDSRKYIRVGCQSIPVDTVKRLIKEYYKLNPKK